MYFSVIFVISKAPVTSCSLFSHPQFCLFPVVMLIPVYTVYPLYLWVPYPQIQLAADWKYSEKKFQKVLKSKLEFTMCGQLFA